MANVNEIIIKELNLHFNSDPNDIKLTIHANSKQLRLEHKDFKFPNGTLRPIYVTCSDPEDCIPLVNKLGAFLKLLQENEFIQNQFSKGDDAYRIVLHNTKDDFSYMKLDLTVGATTDTIKCDLDACCEQENQEFKFFGRSIETEIKAHLDKMERGVIIRKRAAEEAIESQFARARRRLDVSLNLTQDDIDRELQEIAQQEEAGIAASQQEYNSEIQQIALSREASQQVGRFVAGPIISRELSQRLRAPSPLPSQAQGPELSLQSAARSPALFFQLNLAAAGGPQESPSFQAVTAAQGPEESTEDELSFPLAQPNSP